MKYSIALFAALLTALWLFRRIAKRSIEYDRDMPLPAPPSAPPDYDDHMSSPAPPRSAPPRESVEFAAFAPRAITRDATFMLDVWADPANQYSSVIAIAREIGRDVTVGRKTGVSCQKRRNTDYLNRN